MIQALLFAPARAPSSDARLSACGLYRYELVRRWDSAPLLLWVMLNPSVADAALDDPTIRRCIAFSKALGFGGLRVVNLYAWRATDPDAMFDRAAGGVDIVGPENDASILDAAHGAGQVIAAWGADRRAAARAEQVIALLTQVTDVYCLARSQDGAPRHPLYLKADLRPEQRVENVACHPSASDRCDRRQAASRAHIDLREIRDRLDPARYARGLDAIAPLPPAPAAAPPPPKPPRAPALATTPSQGPSAAQRAEIARRVSLPATMLARGASRAPEATAGRVVVPPPVAPERIATPEERFFCPPYGVTMAASSCLARRRDIKFVEEIGGVSSAKANAARERVGRSAYCCGCETGELIQLRIGKRAAK